MEKMKNKYINEMRRSFANNTRNLKFLWKKLVSKKQIKYRMTNFDTNFAK